MILTNKNHNCIRKKKKERKQRQSGGPNERKEEEVVMEQLENIFSPQKTKSSVLAVS